MSSCQTGAGGPEDNVRKVSAFKNTLTFENDPPELSTNVKTPRGGCSQLKQGNTRADFGHFDESHSRKDISPFSNKMFNFSGTKCSRVGYYHGQQSSA